MIAKGKQEVISPSDGDIFFTMAQSGTKKITGTEQAKRKKESAKRTAEIEGGPRIAQKAPKTAQPGRKTTQCS